jgi:GNAT superfamily N-acetyltransferase
MPQSELVRIGEIDRSEHVTREYSYLRGSLEPRDVDVRVSPWARTGDHEHSVQGKINAWQPILEQGGILIGAFDGDSLVGIAIYRPRISEGMANLSVLHVSRSYRRRGIGSLLGEEVARLARADGARHLYVSATPSVPTVDFYRRHGFEPTDEPNEALFALEPLDIHMIRQLRSSL